MIERVLVKEESGKIDSIDTEGINEESRKFIEVSKDIFKSIMMKYKNRNLRCGIFIVISDITVCHSKIE